MRFIYVFLLTSLCWGQNVLTARGDNSRNGSNTSETTITRDNVASKFVLLGTCTVTGDLYSQPLYVQGSPNAIIVATMAGTLVKCNAATGANIWTATLSSPRISYPNVGGEQLLYGNPAGCADTPVVDTSNGWVFVTCTNTTPTQVLYKVRLSDGAVLSSVVLTATVTGTGDPTGGDLVSGGMLTFYPDYEFQRPGLTITGGKVIVPFGSYDDAHPWHGWLFSVDESAMTISGSICLSPNGYGAAVWYSGGPAVDGSGNIYVVTGNGDYDGSANFSESVIKLNSSLVIQDWFTPTDWATMSSLDEDMSAGPILIPGTTLVVAAAKDKRIFSIDTTCMGHLGGTVGGCSAPQIITSDSSILFAMFMNSMLYVSNMSTSPTVHGYALSSSTFSSSPVLSSITSASSGHVLSGSANSTNEGIIWDVTVAASNFTTKRQGTLCALRSDTLAAIRCDPSLGLASKYTPATVADGKVFVSTQSGYVAIYGIAASATPISGTSWHLP